MTDTTEPTTERTDYAKVHFLAQKICKKYAEFGCLVDEEDGLCDKIVDECGASEGDILFLGSDYETRQEYGFYIKTKNGFGGDNEVAYYGGPEGLIEYAKLSYPKRDYTRALTQLYDKWTTDFNCNSGWLVAHKKAKDFDDMIDKMDLEKLNMTMEKIKNKIDKIKKV